MNVKFFNECSLVHPLRLQVILPRHPYFHVVLICEHRKTPSRFISVDDVDKQSQRPVCPRTGQSAGPTGDLRETRKRLPRSRSYRLLLFAPTQATEDTHVCHFEQVPPPRRSYKYITEGYREPYEKVYRDRDLG